MLTFNLIVVAMGIILMYGGWVVIKGLIDWELESND
jgi:hypothetical protein